MSSLKKQQSVQLAQTPWRFRQCSCHRLSHSSLYSCLNTEYLPPGFLPTSTHLLFLPGLRKHTSSHSRLLWLHKWCLPQCPHSGLVPPVVHPHAIGLTPSIGLHSSMPVYRECADTREYVKSKGLYICLLAWIKLCLLFLSSTNMPTYC